MGLVQRLPRVGGWREGFVPWQRLFRFGKEPDSPWCLPRVDSGHWRVSAWLHDEHQPASLSDRSQPGRRR